LKKDKKRLRGHPNDQRECASRDAQHQERAEIVILKVSARWGFLSSACGWGASGGGSSKKFGRFVDESQKIGFELELELEINPAPSIRHRKTNH
jgi:hypothetical protein